MIGQPVNQQFQEELQERLQELDGALLDLTPGQGGPDTVHRVFRALHSMKGSCDMFGLDRAVALLHNVESLWDKVRCGGMPSRNLMDLTFAVRDRLDPVAETGLDLASDESPPGVAGVARPPQEPPRPGGTRTFRVRLSPSDPGHLRRMSPETLLSALGELGEVSATPDTSRVPLLDDLNPSDCYLSWQVVLTTDKGLNAVHDVFLFLENAGDVLIEELPEVESSPPDREPGALSPPTVSARAEAAPAEPPAQAVAARPKSKEPAQSLRVEAAKLDNLVNLVGELVVAQARLAQTASRLDAPELTVVAEEIERLVADLRDNTLGIRMLPIGTTFSRFRRLVRDLSSELGKEIELVTEGGETELDKTVIEQLGDPLVHLLRNSIDHGVESPAERVAAGKPPRGLIRLSANQAGGSVIIRLSDDGRGLDTGRILAKALEKGLVAADARPVDQEVFQLVFAPGFSTAEKVTSVSGRGVGMDVVKRSIESLRGRIEIDSEPGRGTSMAISLPLTLAIIDGLRVRVDDGFYIIPLAMVEECLELPHEDLSPGGKSRALNVRGEIVPYIRLREVFRLGGRPPSLEQVVITLQETGRTGIAVDEVIGQQQTVIKNLGRFIGRVEGISGAAVNGDGSMALILDVGRLVGGARREREGPPGR